MEKISIGQAADKYLSGEIKERFLDAMEAENDLGLDAEVDDNPSTLISSSFIWEDTKEGGKFWIDVANAIFKNPMFYAPKPGQTFRDFAKKYLSGEVYERFINNCTSYNAPGYLDRVPKIEADSDDYFYAPFVWSASPEGHDYWSKVAENFKKDPFYYNKAIKVSPTEKRSWVFWGLRFEDDRKPSWLFETRAGARGFKKDKPDLRIRKYIVTEA